MFLGSHCPRLDDKGRLVLPAKYRAKLADGLVLTRGQEHCLYVFPEEVFNEILGDVITAPLTNKSARDFRRQMLSGAHSEVPDKQGRITIPPQLRAYAGLEREVTVIGTGRNLEIWDTTAWNDYLAASESAYAQMSEEVIPGKV